MSFYTDAISQSPPRPPRFYFINRQARRVRKVFCKDYLFNFPQFPPRTLRSLWFYLINRKVRRERKDFGKEYLFNFPQFPPCSLRSPRFYFN